MHIKVSTTFDQMKTKVNIVQVYAEHKGEKVECGVIETTDDDTVEGQTYMVDCRGAEGLNLVDDYLQLFSDFSH